MIKKLGLMGVAHYWTDINGYNYFYINHELYLVLDFNNQIMYEREMSENYRLKNHKYIGMFFKEIGKI